MKRQIGSTLFLAAAALASLGSLSSLSHAAVTVSVFPAYGPAPTSPSTTAYNANAIAALQGMAVPNRDDDPAGYELTGPGPIPIGEILVSQGFNSWRGQAAPTAGWDDGTITPGAFSSEFGNAVYFGLCAVVDDPVTDGIQLADLSGEIHWEDLGVGPSTIFTQTLSFAAGDLTAYTPNRIGVEFGPDNVPGGGDDTVYTSGPSTQKVDAIYLVGLADAIFVSPDPDPGQTDQDDLTDAVAKLLGPGVPQQLLTASYTLPTMNMPIPTTGVGEVPLVPEPATGGLFAVMLAFIGLRRRG